MTKDSDIGSYDGSPRHWKNLHWTRQIRFIAYNKLRTAIRNGIIPPITADTKCADCGGRAEAYEHRNYFKPLEVDPVCTACNINRGEGYPPVEGDPLYSKGVGEISNKGWHGLEGGVKDGKPSMKGASIKTRISEQEAVDLTFLHGMPQHRKTAFDELFNRNLKYSSLKRGDLRAEYFKKHDPYYICEDIV